MLAALTANRLAERLLAGEECHHDDVVSAGEHGQVNR